MEKFKVVYIFDGNGEVVIEAKNKEEAKEKFFEGEFEKEKEWGENYEIFDIRKKVIIKDKK